MKALIAILLCAVASAAGSAVGWPGTAVALSTPLVKTLVQPATKGFAYSTTQYINALPASYSLGLRPQFAYQIPQVTAYSPLPGLSSYYPIASASYYPTSSVIYPQLSPVTPIQSHHPVTSVPSAPSAPASQVQPGSNLPASPSEKPATDTDTTVIESAEFTPLQQDKQQKPLSDSSPQPQSSQSSSTQYIPDRQQLLQGSDNSNLYPKNPQIAQIAAFPQIHRFEIHYPQRPISLPNFPPEQGGISSPQIPQLPPLPQFPPSQGGSLPQFPQFPQVPQIPEFPSLQEGSFSNFPSADNSNKGLNDEDTVSVDSA